LTVGGKVQAERDECMTKDVEKTRSERDIDPQETQEWKDALEEVVERDGPERAHFLVESLVDKARRSGAYLPYNATTQSRDCRGL
jgi:pyruvate dehydrogenase complex dehydrogenase (E1) component